MAPKASSAATPPFGKDERVLCFHHDMLYEAKVLDSRPTEESSWQYKIHYKGWKNTWDDWVPQDRVRKFTDENKELAAQLHNQMKAATRQPKSARGAARGGKPNGSEMGSGRGSEERNTAFAANSRRGGRQKDYETEAEENFYARPSVKIPMPDHIKAILVDDWENVTKSQLLVPIPARHCVEDILNDYLALEKTRRFGTASLDILEEVIAGLKEYFERCLGRILLYRFERNQYIEAREGWAKKTGEFAGKTATTTYGAEHFCRLLVSLPELIAQTNMDLQSVNRLREELQKLTNWLGKEDKLQEYFVSEYENPGPAYVEKAKTL